MWALVLTLFLFAQRFARLSLPDVPSDTLFYVRVNSIKLYIFRYYSINVEKRILLRNLTSDF